MSLPIVARPVAYNPSRTPIPGTQQIGDLAVGTPTSGFTNNPRFWNGPNETQGYVIAYPVPAGDHPTPIFGVTAYLGFYGTKNMTNPLSESTFVDLANYRFNQNFTSGDEASTWLTNNGYWNSWVMIGTTPTPTASPNVTLTPTTTPTPTPTDISTVTTYTISGCSSSNVIIADLLSPNLFPGDTFYLNFTGATATECYTIISKTSATPADSSSPVTYYADCATCLDQTTTTYLISGCTNAVTLNADLLSPNLFPGDVFNINFTGATQDGCYTVIQKVFNTPSTDTLLSSTFFGNCGLCEASLITPTPTSTPTRTPASTATPTPTPTATSVTPTPTPTSGASGNFNVTISQVGPNVVWNGSGKFNLAALTSAGTNNIGGGFQANQAIWAIGPNVAVDTYSGVTTFPTSFGAGGTPVTSNTGSTFGILPDGFGGRLLYVPSGYTSNTTISGTSTYASQTIAGMGLSGGTYTWSWGTGGNTSTLVMTISS